MRLTDAVEMFGMTAHDEGFADLVSHLERESNAFKTFSAGLGRRTAKALYWMDAWPREKEDVWQVEYSIKDGSRDALWAVNLTAWKEWKKESAR